MTFVKKTDTVPYDVKTIGLVINSTEVNFSKVGKTPMARNASGTITTESVELGAGIVESGNNSNGSWIKYSDGTMIQYGNVALSIISGSQYWNVSSFTFPSNWINSDYKITASGDRTDGDENYSNSNVFLAGPAATYFSTVNFRIGACRVVGVALQNTGSFFEWHAIGRWK